MRLEGPGLASVAAYWMCAPQQSGADPAPPVSAPDRFFLERPVRDGFQVWRYRSMALAAVFSELRGFEDIFRFDTGQPLLHEFPRDCAFHMNPDLLSILTSLGPLVSHQLSTLRDRLSLIGRAPSVQPVGSA